MLRFIRIPAPIALQNDDTGEPLLEHGEVKMFSFAELVRAVRRDPRFVQGTTIYDAIESTGRLIRARTEEVVPVEEEIWNALNTCVLRPQVFGPAFLWAPDAPRMLRAITDAKDKDPGDKVEPVTNGTKAARLRT